MKSPYKRRASKGYQECKNCLEALQEQRDYFVTNGEHLWCGACAVKGLAPADVVAVAIRFIQNGGWRSGVLYDLAGNILRNQKRRY